MWKILALAGLLISGAALAAEKAPEENAAEPDALAEGLVLLLSHRDPGIPSDTIRVTIENRSGKLIKVVAPPDIYGSLGRKDGWYRPSGRKDGWWYCGAYKLYLSGPDGRVRKFVCDTLQPPAQVLEPKPVVIDLLPGQSNGALFAIGVPSEVSSFWQDAGKDKQRVEHKGRYTLTAEYDPSYVESNGGPKLAPYAGHKLTSNTLDFKIKDTETHNKAIDGDKK